ncbi:hypothetical protein AKJ52_00050 [candidate division MSBL1 archaeon SCGC-AAA382C18]|uniref:Uncharacterized protein n=1 Tax=candidate division MSBL1 archaeon SCGC-AAA382C18 TaxID=1698281 RepID=A0A133VM04_9EURY|nr:hypothetical protein AKJ52_00050 [candidate division MSBL1 archaeon SCGC-AAA382C18]
MGKGPEFMVKRQSFRARVHKFGTQKSFLHFFSRSSALKKVLRVFVRILRILRNSPENQYTITYSLKKNLYCEDR